MFLITLGHGFGNRIVQKKFQHSGKTISRHFTRVLMDVSRMVIDIINPIDIEFMDVSSKICGDERYWPYFKDCFGVIDGTHVPVKISPSKQMPYIGQKGTPTQNVMAVCDFRMYSHLFGLEGKVLHMIHIFFWKLFERKNCDFHNHPVVCI